MKAVLKTLCAPFAAATIGLSASAAAQEAPPATPAPAAPSAELPDLNTFNPRDHFIKDDSGKALDSRGPMYLCADNTTSCWTQEQREAWAVREFQLMMRTTVYSCQQYYPGEQLIDSYNAIVDNNRDTLQQSFHTVAAYFTSKSETPRAALLAFDALEIASGNIYSGAGSPEYCAPATQVLRHAASLQDDAAVVRIAHRIMLRPAA